MTTRTVKITVTDSDGIVLDSISIEMNDNETKVAITPLHEGQSEPNMSAAVLVAR